MMLQSENRFKILSVDALGENQTWAVFFPFVRGDCLKQWSMIGYVLA